jgi:twitching motility protein PilI
MPKRSTLRDFQQELSRRLAIAASSHGENTSVLAVESAGETWVLGLIDAGEVLPVPKLTAVPLIKPWYAGFANIRGNVYSVVDFAAFRGAPPARLGAASRLVLCGQRHGVNAGLLVDRVIGLRDGRELKEIDDGMPAPAWQKAVKTDGDGRRCRELDTSALVHSAEFMSIAV